ncbi:hypothetical protein K6V78_09715 [Streptococcus gallolyticus]|nr:hypothetical protein [Streptococcus gallolyticus]MBY5041774.1 hypothetical protein [Streptococcus gallolyticus]
MDEIKIENQVSLSDLRKLGRQGGVTARLDDGSDMKLLPQFGTVKRKGYISGKVTTVEVVYAYPDVYSQIRTLKRKEVLIARREKVNKKSVLKLTGRGYNK